MNLIKKIINKFKRKTKLKAGDFYITVDGEDIPCSILAQKFTPNYNIIINHFNYQKDNEWAFYKNDNNYYEINNIKITISQDMNFNYRINIYLLDKEDRNDTEKQLKIYNAFIATDGDNKTNFNYINGNWDSKIKELLVRLDSESETSKMIIKENIDKVKNKEQLKINKFNKIYEQ